jgi:tRNA threonylcarbamoyladenosine biosynthesis protein TsaB
MATRRFFCRRALHNQRFMKLLAFDTSTEALSIAVCRDGTDAAPQIWQHSAAGGAQASAALIPAILALLAQADVRLKELDAIAFGAGPGSFTGLRTACSVAQGLGFGAGVPLLPVDTLLAVAEQARLQRAEPQRPFRVVAALDARMDELYVGRYVFDGLAWAQAGDGELLRPEDLVLEPGWTLAGNVAAVYGDRLGMNAGGVLHAWPSASAMLRLAPALLAAGLAVAAEQALPRYIRDKVAKTTVERAAEKFAAAPV